MFESFNTGFIATMWGHFSHGNARSLVQYSLSTMLYCSVYAEWMFNIWVDVKVIPSGVGNINSSQVDALTANNEERRETEQRHSAADHG